MVAESKALARKGSEKKGRSYWQRRRSLIYLFAAKQICTNRCGKPESVIDVGSNGTPTLEWHRKTATHLVSVDLRKPYVAEGVESVKCDFLKYQPNAKFDLVTCFQVLEHVPYPEAFSRKILDIGKIAVVSVPYKWQKGKCKYHLHDPVDEGKMRNWFGRAPDFSYVATELNTVSRLIHVYKQ